MLDVSVIIPTYNSAKFISKCLDSMERQKFRNFEVIIVDDNSSDNTLEILEEFRKLSCLLVTIIRNDTNKGPGVSRETGLKNANGRYITFCDSDDWYEDGFLSTLHRKIAGEGYDIVFCNYYKVLGDKKLKMARLRKSYSKSKLIINNAFSLCLMMIKKELLNGKFVALYNAEDIVTLVNIMTQDVKIGVCEEYLYNYFTRKGSASVSPKKSTFNELYKAYTLLERRDKFKKEIEYISIYLVIYSSVICYIKARSRDTDIKKNIRNFEMVYPNWRSNKYLRSTSIYHFIFYKTFSKNSIWLIKIIYNSLQFGRKAIANYL